MYGQSLRVYRQESNLKVVKIQPVFADNGSFFADRVQGRGDDEGVKRIMRLIASKYEAIKGGQTVPVDIN